MKVSCLAGLHLLGASTLWGSMMAECLGCTVSSALSHLPLQPVKRGPVPNRTVSEGPSTLHCSQHACLMRGPACTASLPTSLERCSSTAARMGHLSMAPEQAARVWERTSAMEIGSLLCCQSRPLSSSTLSIMQVRTPSRCLGSSSLHGLYDAILIADVVRDEVKHYAQALTLLTGNGKYFLSAGEPADRDKREWASSTSIECLPAEEKQLLSSPAASKLRMRSLQVCHPCTVKFCSAHRHVNCF